MQGVPKLVLQRDARLLAVNENRAFMTAVFIANFRSDPFVASVGLLPTGVLSALRWVKKYTKRMAA